MVAGECGYYSTSRTYLAPSAKTGKIMVVDSLHILANKGLRSAMGLCARVPPVPIRYTQAQSGLKLIEIFIFQTVSNQSHRNYDYMLISFMNIAVKPVKINIWT
jgi:hypothetical protein